MLLPILRRSLSANHPGGIRELRGHGPWEGSPTSRSILLRYCIPLSPGTMRVGPRRQGPGFGSISLVVFAPFRARQFFLRMGKGATEEHVLLQYAISPRGILRCLQNGHLMGNGDGFYDRFYQEDLPWAAPPRCTGWPTFWTDYSSPPQLEQGRPSKLDNTGRSSQGPWQRPIAS